MKEEQQIKSFRKIDNNLLLITGHTHTHTNTLIHTYNSEMKVIS